MKDYSGQNDCNEVGNESKAGFHEYANKDCRRNNGHHVNADRIMLPNNRHYNRKDHHHKVQQGIAAETNEIFAAVNKEIQIVSDEYQHYQEELPGKHKAVISFILLPLD